VSSLQNPRGEAQPKSWLVKASWGIAILMVALTVFIGVRKLPQLTTAASRPVGEVVVAQPDRPTPAVPLPVFRTGKGASALVRVANPRTIVPVRERGTGVEYEVQAGDSLFRIAQVNKIKPESILWSNYDTLTGNPDLVEPGIKLILPPTDGVYYLWQKGDTIESVAVRFKARMEDILLWPGNHLDLTNPQVEPGSFVMVPGGQREMHDWLMPTIPQGKAGVALNIPGTCDTGDKVVVGGTNFIWPAANHSISGNDFWSGHLALDIGAGTGMPVVASEAGMVVFAGGASNGYGRMVMVDHGNSFQTLYAHLSEIAVRCGQTVKRGQMLGMAGSTGNSTGPHLHFEVRRGGGFLNPWDVLPAP